MRCNDADCERPPVLNVVGADGKTYRIAVGDGITKDTAAIQKAIESYRITEEQKAYLRTLKIK